MIKNVLDKDLSKKMFKMAIPIAISGIIIQLQMLIDTAFLGRYSATLADGSILSGDAFLSAVGNVFFPYTVSLAFLWSITTGILVLVSQRLGAKEPEQARKYAEAGIKFNTLLAIGVYLFWLIFTKEILIFLNVKEPILTLSVNYMRFLSIELLVLGTSVSIGATLQGMGKTRPEMYMGILRSVINIILDYLLIFGNFGFPEMGVKGAGLATSISAIITGAIFLVIFLKSKNLDFRPRLMSIVKAPFSTYKTVFKVGLPTGIEDMLWNSGNLVLTYFLNILSHNAVGIYRLVFQIEITPIFFYAGLARAVSTMVGNHTGARDISGAKRVAFLGKIYCGVFCVLFVGLFVIFPGQVLGIFTDNLDIVKLATPFLIITAFTMIPRAINIVSGNAIRGYGDTLWMLATQIFGISFLIGVSYSLMFTYELGMLGLFIAMFADEVIRGTVNTIRFYRGETSIFFKGLVT